MKKVALSLVAIFLMSTAFAGDDMFSLAKKRRKKGSDGAFSQGCKIVHVGVGFVPFVLKPEVEEGLAFYGETEADSKMLFGAGFEFGVADFLSVGGMFGHTATKLSVIDVTNPENINGFDIGYTIIGIRASYHLKTGSEKLDPYAGVMFGGLMASAKSFGERNYFEQPKAGGLAWQIYAGAQFYIIDHVGLFAELGFKYALINTGVSFKF